MRKESSKENSRKQLSQQGRNAISICMLAENVAGGIAPAVIYDPKIEVITQPIKKQLNAEQH